MRAQFAKLYQIGFIIIELMEKRRQFKINPVHKSAIPYDPLVDHHLEYYFSSRKNRQILLKTKVVNRRNQILDKNLCKLIEHGQLNVSNKFRLKKSKPKRQYSKNSQQIQSKSYSFHKSVGKKQFQEFLESRKNQIKNKTMNMRYYEHPINQKTIDIQGRQQKKDV